MAEKTVAERYSGAIAILEQLEREGHAVHGLKRLSLSSTGRAKEPAPVVDTPKETPKTIRGAFIKDKDEAQS